MSVLSSLFMQWHYVSDGYLHGAVCGLSGRGLSVACFPINTDVAIDTFLWCESTISREKKLLISSGLLDYICYHYFKKKNMHVYFTIIRNIGDLAKLEFKHIHFKQTHTNTQLKDEMRLNKDFKEFSYIFWKCYSHCPFSVRMNNT